MQNGQWQVALHGISGQRYVWTVDLPAAADHPAVISAAFLKHAAARREGIVTERADKSRMVDVAWVITYTTKEDITCAAAFNGVDLEPDHIKGAPGAYTIDGMPWNQWLDAMIDD